MREDAVLEFLKKAKADWGVVERMIKEGKLVEAKYKNRIFYIRKLVSR